MHSSFFLDTYLTVKYRLYFGQLKRGKAFTFVSFLVLDHENLPCVISAYFPIGQPDVKDPAKD